ncbi:DUF485 domain-containing protein [Azohydromonas lata]|uniref:DUF485 domain-containing protein n=1 Tax=Azohydromonas lata TaxID=45677 RepID=A0ABU5IQR5_9BURK|nr:DUF485 domain-containing protein [Azohydromonas lata]MDZ5461223.1 DUF485 domain-containing protein [Azohydromonas lata]
MSADIYRKVENDPMFKELVAKRSRLAITLSAVVLVAYYAFMAVVAFAPDIFGKPLFEGSALTIGGPIGALLIIVSWLLTGLYVSRANGEFDRMTQDIVERNA